MLIAVAAMVMVPLMAIAGFFLKIMKDGAARRVQDRADMATHERIEGDIKDIQRKQAIDSDRLSAIEGELKRMNGKH